MLNKILQKNITMKNTTNIRANLILDIFKYNFDKCTLKLKSLFAKRKLNRHNTYYNDINFVSIGNVNDAPFEKDDHFFDNKYIKFYECLNTMPKIQKKVFLMKTFEQRSVSFICENLDISEKIFWYYMKKSRHELMVSLQLF